MALTFDTHGLYWQGISNFLGPHSITTAFSFVSYGLGSFFSIRSSVLTWQSVGTHVPGYRPVTVGEAMMSTTLTIGGSVPGMQVPVDIIQFLGNYFTAIPVPIYNKVK